jgi:hypothetical protein
MPESEHQQVIDDLIKERHLIQSSASRFIKFVKNFNNTNNIRNLSTRLADFRPVLDKFNKVQFEIDLKSNEEDEALRDAFESEYYDAIARAEEILERGTMQSSSNATDIKLPTINLPNFNGNYTDWTPFYESFRSLIHENNNLEKIQKLHYLRSCLGAEARRTIDTLAVSADSYDTAWRLLKERYQNKRLIVQHHIHGLFNLPQITKPSPSSLRDLTDKLNAHLESLKSQNLQVEKWDAMIIYLIASKFDTQTKGEWETKLTSNELPSLQDMKSFLIQKCQTLESIEFATSSTPQYVHPTKPKPTEAPKRFNTASSLCIKCNESHFLHQCPEFLQLNPNARYDDVRNFKLCVNCLKGGHDAKACQSRTCKTCGKRHHTTLHFPKRETASGSNVNNHCESTETTVLLTTAVIKVRDNSGQLHKARALLDNGSQQNFIREDLCKKLGISLVPHSTKIRGIGSVTNQTTQSAEIRFNSVDNSFTKTIHCLVMPEITSNLPPQTLDLSNIIIPENIKLADPGWYITSPIDLLLGSALFYDLLKDGKIKLNNNQTFVQNSCLGWLIGGPFSINLPCQNFIACHATSDLERQVAQFWQIEEFPDNKQLESQDICETLFRETHERTPEGRFVVKLPFKNNPPSVGPTRPMAIKQFKRLETRFAANEQLHLEYDNFIKEYLQLKHMEIVGSDELFTSAAYYLPHHPIIKQSSLTTKTRVVFNASFKAGGDELSLNDNLFTGPNLQNDIFSLLLKCRVHKILLSADITKMFRQILVHPQNRDYLRIVYRDNPNTPIKTYRLKTVTYGLNCAPFLAMRCLHELAHQFANSKPRACDAITNAFYMDDLLIGVDSIEEATILRDDLINILAQGGFELCKWASNCVAVLPKPNRGGNATTIGLDANAETTTLGLTWNCSKDVFKTVKAYVALFVCLATKAIHLELVGDHTAESFKNCLKRMMARRGIVANLYSDNGTNFVGTDRELKETYFLLQQDKVDSIKCFLADRSINWHFIPPHSPHMGGIWEAGVKSCKYHFKRIVGNALLRYEELYTLLTLIESCLNSRPITPMSNDPHDLEALTPGHFLIGAPLTAPLEPNLEETQSNRLSRWELVERLRQQWWSRWSHEYLHQLQTRAKWRSKSSDIRPGKMVVIKEENVPPLLWRLGRIHDLHPGGDGAVRVVTIKTARGIIKRAVHKVCPLPIVD